MTAHDIRAHAPGRSQQQPQYDKVGERGSRETLKRLLKTTSVPTDPIPGKT